MRIPAEPRDDLAMLQSVGIIAAAAFTQQIVIAQRFAVHQRHVKKIQVRFAQYAVKPSFDAFPGESHRLRVEGKRAYRPTEHVARELIEHDDQCQKRVGAFAPRIKVSRTGSFIGSQKSLPYLGVKRVKTSCGEATGMRPDPLNKLPPVVDANGVAGV
jgi:hypothetical protein